MVGLTKFTINTPCHCVYVCSRVSTVIHEGLTGIVFVTVSLGIFFLLQMIESELINADCTFKILYQPFSSK